MRLYQTKSGFVIEEKESYYSIEDRDLGELLAQQNIYEYLSSIVERGKPFSNFDDDAVLAPIGSQEVWAAGVTYYRSRSARIEESKDAGSGDFYDRVYLAERPELFFKSMPHKVVGNHQKVRICGDARWSVPELELALLINQYAEIVGYTIGNDMSSRDIEGANPLYLPQAKVYDASCALGPCILIQEEPPPQTAAIHMEIIRAGESVFTGSTSLSELKRSPAILVEYLFRDHSFPYGCFLLTGTGIIPPDAFTLQAEDEIRISMDGIGTLVNMVA